MLSDCSVNEDYNPSRTICSRNTRKSKMSQGLKDEQEIVNLRRVNQQGKYFMNEDLEEAVEHLDKLIAEKLELEKQGIIDDQGKKFKIIKRLATINHTGETESDSYSVISEHIKR